MGPPGAGKSDLLLRLLELDFELVADDRVDIDDGIARPPAALAGLLELRGLGIFRMPHRSQARLALVVRLGPPAARLPEPELDAELGLPLVHIDPASASAPARIGLALDCAIGRVVQHCGAFAA